MSIPLLNHAYSSQNQRVTGYEVGSEETPIIYNRQKLTDGNDADNLIRSVYVQIFNEQQLIQSNRQTHLESQLRAGHITVKEFIRGLLLSDSFRRRNYEVNNNYRFVEMCIQRVLGREVYDRDHFICLGINLSLISFI
jgi:phycobilisome rod-core linker protein